MTRKHGNRPKPQPPPPPPPPKRLAAWLGWVKGPTGFLLTAIVGAVVGGIATSYFGLIQHNRTVVEADFSTLKKTAEDLRPLLYAYRNRAVEGTPVDEDTKRNFRIALTKLYNQADSITKRDPRVQPEFSEFERALVSLKENADKVTGPLDAKPFVEAVGGYFAAEDRFTKKISDLQRSFMSAFRTD